MRLLVLVLFLLGPAAWASESDPLASGFALLDEAVKLRVSDPARSARLAGDAAALIRSSLPGEGAGNAPAQRALGNAWLLSGDLGRAVLAYRRAEAAAPGDPIVAASLEHARSLVPVESGETGARGAWGRWSGLVPRGVVFWAGLGLFVAGCWALALRVVSVLPGIATAPSVAAVVLGGACLGALAGEPLVTGSGWGVVVRSEVGRTGPHASLYPPALDGPVPAGAEVRVVEARDGWVLCSLGGRRAWLPGDAVERVGGPVAQDAGAG